MAATSGQVRCESPEQSIECTGDLIGSPEQSSSPEAEQVRQWSSAEQMQAEQQPQVTVSDALLPVLSLTVEEDCELKQRSSRESSPDQKAEEKAEEDCLVAEVKPISSAESTPIELRFLVRRREAGALIGKRGLNIKRLRETFRCSMFSIPDTGNGPERVVCIVTNEQSVDAILGEFTELLWEKSPENDEQIELKILIHSSHAGSIIGIGGQSIKKLRNDSKAAIKIYEMCCPLSNERVCAIKAKPAVVVSTIKLIHSILRSNPTKGTVKAYDALHFDLNLVDKYGGYLHDEQQVALAAAEHLLQLHHQHNNSALDHYNHHFRPEYKRYSLWRSPDFRALDTCQFHEPQTNQTCQQLAQLNKASLSSSSTSEQQQQQQRDVGAVDESEKSSVAGGASCAYSPQPMRLNRFHPYAAQMRHQQAPAADHFGQHYLRPLHHHHHHHHQLPPAYLRFHPNYGPSTPLLNRNHYQQQQQQQHHHLFPFGLPSDRCRHARPTCNHHLPSSGPSVHQHQVVAHNNTFNAAAAAAAPFMQLVKQFNHQPHSNSNSTNNNNNNNKKK